MKKLFNRAKFVMNGEEGGPQIETIILIAVALIIGVALLAFGRQIVTWISGAQDQVADLEIGEIGG